MMTTTMPAGELHAVTVTDQGPRRIQADAAASRREPIAGTQAWALADGVGDDYEAADAARMAVDAAVSAALERGAFGGIVAAREVLNAFYADAPPGQDGDCTLVVAVPFPARRGGGLDVAWAGDSRAYLQRPDGRLLQLTADHTLGRQFAAAGQPDWLRALAAGADHTLTSSARRGEIGQRRILGPARRVLLCSDGLHRHLTHNAISTALATGPTPHTAAAALLRAVRVAGLPDNVTVTVIGTGPDRSWP
jgi:PPM family protein phosphatase